MINKKIKGLDKITSFALDFICFLYDVYKKTYIDYFDFLILKKNSYNLYFKEKNSYITKKRNIYRQNNIKN